MISFDDFINDLENNEKLHIINVIVPFSIKNSTFDRILDVNKLYINLKIEKELLKLLHTYKVPFIVEKNYKIYYYHNIYGEITEIKETIFEVMFTTVKKHDSIFRTWESKELNLLLDL